jgi:hypothetical protein
LPRPLLTRCCGNVLLGSDISDFARNRAA